MQQRTGLFCAGALLTAVLVLPGCAQDAPTDENAASTPPASTAPETAPASAGEGAHAFSPEIRAEDFAEHVRVLASDEFEGRAPGSAGEEKTVAYIQGQFERIGLEPGNNGSWVQTVPMVETTTAQNTTLTLTHDGETRRLVSGTDMVIGTRTGRNLVEIEGSELVFVGYGVVAPEQDWNDYEGLDVKGKTVVILVNDPGFHVDDPELFGGERMTYYGRWTYKFEEAARQGAEAALIVHDDAGAGYGWDVVKNSWSGAQFDLPAADDPAPRLPAQGWLSAEAANRLFEENGLDFEAQRRAASQRDFRPVPLATTLDLSLRSAIREAKSDNVLGLLRGSTRPDEVVVYMGHWDHLGKTMVGRNVPGGGTAEIYNGAIDNASGIAGILEIAEAFKNQETPPERSILFLAVTLEESGLLGSAYYTANPVFPLAKTVAAINLDAMPVIGRTTDMTVTGIGSSELEDILKPIAALQNRVLRGEAETSKGFYFRSDHFNFAKAGVPALYAKGGTEHVEGGVEHVRRIQAEYGANRYHKPGDVYEEDWDLSGVVEDLEALYAVGRELTGSEALWPNWYPDNPFRAARDATADQRPAP
ncbi:M28 family metallopeptidase [Coralloluteibacterium thermophilus]|uniref:M28 family metallopeptidase n=1 Tax=Coralloluteibacterium thermophilum TaxID=2707049 RepID=A0ABV9NKP5_9GAMM